MSERRSGLRAGSGRRPGGLATPRSALAVLVVLVVVAVVVALAVHRTPAPAVKASVTGKVPSSVKPAASNPVSKTSGGMPKGLARWYAALARGTAKLAVYGDSISEDAPSRTGAWPGLLRAKLSSQINTATGTGVVLLTPNSVTEEPRVTYTGQWINSPQGIDGAAREATGPGSTLAFKPGVAGDAFEVYYRTGPQWGTFTYQVDDGASASVDANSAANGVSSVSIPVSENADHVLTIASPADPGGVVDISAVELTKGTNGLRLADLAVSGAGTNMFNSPPGLAGSFAPIRPNLSVIFLEANDYATQVPLATYRANLEAAIAQADLTGDVLLVATVPNNYKGAHPIVLAQYTAVLQQLAAGDKLAFLNLTRRWGSFAQGTAHGLYKDDLTHPSAKGAADIARAVYSAIVPANGGHS